MATPLQKILYVEDDIDIQMLAQMSLKMGGINATFCNSGEKALEKVQTFTPQLIVLDVCMPGMDGPTTLKELRKLPQTADVPAIFMTAQMQAADVKRYKEIGAVDVIAKPFDPMTLASKMKKIWEKHAPA